MGKLFGTDGVRGLANVELTPELAFKLGRAGAYVLTKTGRRAPKIIVGTDTRRSCGMLSCALTAGMCSVGADVYSAGVIPTPGVAYLVRKYQLDAGVVISASHNPMQDNGIKFFNSEGYKLPDALEDEIEGVIETGLDDLPRPSGADVGSQIMCDKALDDYIAFLRSTADTRLDGMIIALDCGNGATFEAAPYLFSHMGAKVLPLNNDPDGKNINAGCGSTHMEPLMEFVRKNKADVGIAFDGDGDRCLMVDERGGLVQGDEIMSICGNIMKDERRLKQDTIVATVMSNLGLTLMGEARGINIVQTKVGDRYVLEKMLESGYSFGGEQSGHIIFLDHTTTGDGILTALQMLLVMKKTGKTLSQLNTYMTVLPQVLVNARVANEKKYDYLKHPGIQAEIKALESKFAGSADGTPSAGRVLIRPSGTEPVVRVMLEGRKQAVLQREAKRLAAMLEELFG
ncbi:MAG: phosphoglucosamine mutase [Clostridiales bacterium]|nr:phosphoglucosamine mutase [Clostridiales bacterium]